MLTRGSSPMCCIVQRNALPVTLLSVFLFLWCGSAFAAPVTWNGGSGLWSVPANWTPSLPVAASDVTISVPGAQTVTHSTGSDTINTLAIGTGTNTLLINGGSTLGIS